MDCDPTSSRQAGLDAMSREPDLTVMTETCPCSYTPAGECHLANPRGAPDVPGIVEALAEQAVAQAEAGADVVGPTAMISGSVSATRSALDAADHQKVEIMPHVIVRSDLYDGHRRARWTRRRLRACAPSRYLPRTRLTWSTPRSYCEPRWL
jgi:delta-aminolevulinic acid dehydratase/porphobilinogen synthase